MGRIVGLSECFLIENYKFLNYSWGVIEIVDYFLFLNLDWFWFWD